MKLKKLFSLIVAIVLMLSLTAADACALARKESKWQQLHNNRSGVMVVAYRGEASFYPPNSAEAVWSAFEAGADMVSVSVQKTKDGVLVLCENENLRNVCKTSTNHISEITFEEFKECELYRINGELSGCYPVSLVDILNEDLGDGVLILDIDKEDKELVYKTVVEERAEERVILRYKDHSEDIARWIESKKIPLEVMGVYSGGIIFTTLSHLNRLSAVSPVVQYQSKNYFNVMFESLVTKNYSKDDNARAAIAMYDPDLCGQRSDTVTGWNEVISKGFSVIESANLSELVSYVERTEYLRGSLGAALSLAEKADLGTCSEVSAANLREAVKKGNEVHRKGIVSEEEFQKAIAEINLSLINLNRSEGKETQKGALNITAGKVIAVVLVGAVLLLAEIYVSKMQREKKKKIK